MDMPAVLKAGGIGAVVIIVLNLLGLIPCVGCITLFLVLIAYVGIGVLAAYWLAPPRTSGSGAKSGAAAALFAGLIAGLVNMVIQGIYFAITGTSELTQALADLPAEQLDALQQAGIDPSMLSGLGGIGAILGIGAVCCTLGLFIAAGLGAAGGAFWGNSHPN